MLVQARKQATRKQARGLRHYREPHLRVRDGSPMEVWPTAACTGALLASNETKYLQGRGEMFLFSFLRARYVSRLDIGRGVDRLFILVGQPNE